MFTGGPSDSKEPCGAKAADYVSDKVGPLTSTDLGGREGPLTLVEGLPYVLLSR